MDQFLDQFTCDCSYKQLDDDDDDDDDDADMQDAAVPADT